MRVELLGTFRLTDGSGREMPVRSPKLRALIAYLTLNADQPVRREALATLLWGDSPDAQARQSLRQALLSLRKTLGEAADALVADDETVMLRRSGVASDVADFEALVAEGRPRDAALAYPGDLADEPAARAEAFDAWMGRERARLHDLACAALEGHVDGLLREGDASAAVLAARQLCALDPWRESATRLLMRAYVQAGRRAEALQHYRTVAETLRRELDAEPDAETTRLHDDIRDGTAASGRADRGEDTDKSGNGAAPPFVPVAPAESPGRRRGWVRPLAAAGLVALALAGWSAWTALAPGSRTDPDAASPAVTAETPSIAVLPFVNMSDDPDQEYFADGISEDIMTGLSKFGQVSVISRNSTFGYKGRSVEVAEVARDLGARYVLEGSVRRSGDRIRITALLVDALADKHIWAERYDRELKDVFAVQDDITHRIVTAVAPEFLSAEMGRAMTREARDLEAWDAYIRGYWHLLRFTRDDNAEARRLLDRAIALEPNRANYHGLLSVVDLMDGLYGWSESRDEAFRRSLASAERGLALDDRDAQVLRSAGLVHFFSRNHDVALDYYRRAVDANPNEAENRALLGAALGVAGDYAGAREQYDIAFRLSPRDVHIATWYNYLAVAAFVAGLDEEAVTWSKKTIQANPKFPGGYRSLAASAGNLGRVDEARSARERLLEFQPGLTIARLRESLPYFTKPETMERYLDGLRKAGLPEGGS